MKLVKNFKESIIESVGDGYGFRLVLFLQGCPHHCKNCHNVSTWNKDLGVNYSVNELFVELSKLFEEGFYTGITFSGGDPLLQHEELNELVLLLKGKHPDKDITIYTGYLYSEIKNLPIIKNIDYLIDGKFEEDKKSINCKFRGSTNQKLYHLKDGKIIKVE